MSETDLSTGMASCDLIRKFSLLFYLRFNGGDRHNYRYFDYITANENPGIITTEEGKDELGCRDSEESHIPEHLITHYLVKWSLTQQRTKAKSRVLISSAREIACNMKFKM